MHYLANIMGGLIVYNSFCYGMFIGMITLPFSYSANST